MDKKLRAFNLRNPSEFRFLESVSLDRRFFEGFALPYILRLKLSKEMDESSDRIVLEFSGVRDLHWGDLSVVAGVFLQIFDVSEHQLEGIRFRVIDEEENVVAFYCNDFEIL